MSTNSSCSLCDNSEGDIEHLFCRCKETKQLWDNIEHWINVRLQINLRLSNLMKLLGYLTNDQTFWPLNLILTLTRKYMFMCSKNKFKLNIFHLQKDIKNAI